MMSLSIEGVSEALTYISSDICRDEWVRVGMAIKSQFPGDDGFRCFDDWSQTSPGRYNAQDTRSTWFSIRADGGVGLGTLIHLAKAGGYTSSLPARIRAQADVQVAVSSARAGAEASKIPDCYGQQQKRLSAATAADVRWNAVASDNYLDRSATTILSG